MASEDEQVVVTLKKLYKAHDIIANINEKIERLYLSASYASPVSDGMPKAQNSGHNKLEHAICEIADLKTYIAELVTQRAKFDVFLCTLDLRDEKVLSMRCEQELSWKEISSELRISMSTVKDIFRKARNKAKEYGF